MAYWHLKSVIAFTVVSYCFALSVRANLITNGSFEVGTLPTPPGTTFVAGSTAIDSWIVGGHGIDYIGTYWQAADGSRSIDLDSGTVLGAGPYDGSIAQTFTTTPGGRYSVDFELAGNPDGAPSLKSVSVSAGGQAQTFSFLNSGQTHDNMGYLPQEFVFTANGSSTTLTFTSLSGTGYGPVIDNVVVSQVPEPSALVAASMAMLIVRRRKQA